MKFARAIAIFAICAFPAASQWIHYPTPGTPRTADGRPKLTAPAPRARNGKPDLSGIWDPDYSIPRVPAGVVVAGSLDPTFSLQFWRPNAAPLPMTPWAEAIFRQRDRNFGAGRPAARCLPHGIPDGMLAANFKIVQNPGVTFILYEEFARFRQIFTDGRAHPKNPNPAWLGYSIGKWERDSFVVDTVGFNDQSWLDDAGHPHSEALRTIERFRRRDFGHMDVEVTIEDPKAYTEPWSANLHFRLLPDTELIENVCDNERDGAHLVGRVASDEKKSGVDVEPEILSQYVGTYELGTPGEGGFVLDVSRVNGQLVASGAVLTALSPAEFSSSYGNMKFVKDREGTVTTLILSWTAGGEDALVRRK